MSWNLLLGSVFLTILQIFNPEVTLIRDQVWINVGAYEPKNQINKIVPSIVYCYDI